jgi:hypothetical protein
MVKLSQASRDFLAALSTDFSRAKSSAPANPERDLASQPWVDTAAVLHVFTLQDLPIQFRPTTQGALELMRNASFAAPGYQRQRGRTLTAEHRQNVLRRIADPGRALALINASPERIPTLVQRHFERLLAGENMGIGTLSHADLIALREANRWMADLSKSPFTDKELEIAIESAAAMSSIEHLLGEAFVGRDDEIAELHKFTGIRQRGLLESLGDYVRGTGDRLLMIEGPGGIGKTAVIGHFLFDSRSDEGGPLFPFAYLPCDDRTMDIREIHPVLSEVARQFARLVGIRRAIVGDKLEVSQFQSMYENFQKLALDYGKKLVTLGNRRSEFVSQEQRLASTRGAFNELAVPFAMLVDATCAALQRSGEASPPALLFIDTFEEVQYQTRERLDPFWRLLLLLFDKSVQLKVLISGRPPLADPPTTLRRRKFILKELKPEAAVDLLRRETGLPPEQLETVARQIGGNPLNLRLAARIIADEKPKAGEGIAGLQTRRFGFFRLQPELVRGRLYRRLLERIHDDDVRKLAHPGMILRRVTAGIIKDVLAPVCNLEGVDAQRATELFEALGNEHTLVRIEPADSLRYREDVRAPVVALLAADEPNLTQRVHAAAVQYYRPAKDPVSVAEFIYHGLMIGLDGDDLSEHWKPEAEAYLLTAIEELPPEGKLWLATRMSLAITPELEANASIAAWEKIVAPRAISLLEDQGSQAALKLLGERTGRTPDSALFAIEARCLMSLGRLEDAARLLQAALDAYPIQGNRGRRAELLWLLHQVELNRNQPAAALSALDGLVEVAASLRNGLPLVQALAAQVQLLGRDSAEAAPRQDALVTALRQLRSEEVFADPDVVRTALAALPIDRVAAARSVIPLLSTSLYRVIEDPKFTLQPRWQQELLKLLQDAGSAGTNLVRAGYESLGNMTKQDLGVLLQAALAVPLSEPNTAATREEIFAARIVWIILQMETGTLAAATLAGIEEYRGSWQRYASARSAA